MLCKHNGCEFIKKYFQFLFLGIGFEVDDDSQPEDGDEGEEAAAAEAAEAAQETDSVTIEVPDHPSPGSPPPQPAENAPGSPQGSRPSTARGHRQQETSPANQLAGPWGQSGLMGIGIDEVGMLIFILNRFIAR